jgi:aminopeptidase N
MPRLRARVWLALFAIVPLMAAPLRRPFAVETYNANLRLDLARQTLSGAVTLNIRGKSDTPISAIELDAGPGLQIAAVSAGESPQYFEHNRSTLAVVLTSPLRPDELRTLSVRYQAEPSPGLKFFPDQVYATVAGDWLPCDERPGERAALHLALTAPSGMEVAAGGQLAPARASSPGVTEWQLEAPAPTAWFGFVAGNFAEYTRQADGVSFRVLGAGSQVLDPVGEALRFLKDRAGKSYPAPGLTLAFVHGDAAQALAGGLTLVPESQAAAFGKSAESLRLLAGLLARQWYGLSAEIKDWGELWLSDGISAFLADAFLSERLGTAAYDREIERSRQVYNRLRTEDKDRPLSYLDWKTRQDASGELPEHKGVCFLYLVRALVGENAFWNALRTYTADEWGQAATSEDFQKAFAAAGAGASAGAKKSSSAKKGSANALDTLFDNWVWGITRNGK